MHTTARDFHRVRFAEFELDLRSGELWKDGARTALANQPFRILAFLVGHRGVVVTRDELRCELWPEDTFVDFEHSLNAGIRRLRDALGDSAASPRFIETIPQRGYRFIATVEESCVPVSLPPNIPERPAPNTAASRALKVWWIAAAAAAALSIAVPIAWMNWRVRSAAGGPAGRQAVRLTATSGLNIEPTLSPDGSLVAYASDRAGNLDIYVQPVAGGEPVNLTRTAADEAEPSFSPDGSGIVFSRRDSGLFIVPALGGDPRIVTPTPWARTPRFSPDGRWIAYWTGFAASVVAGGLPGALGSIFVVSSQDGDAPREIRTPLASARYPVWSPDGASILFLGEEDAERKTHDWYVIPRDGGTAVKTGVADALRAAGLGATLPIPGAWTARDHAVVFATNEVDSSSVWQIRISPVTGRVEGGPEPLTFGTAVERNPVVADSGRVAFTSLVENIDIWRLPLDPKTGMAAGPLERLTDNAASDRLRNVSADGKRVFFISSRTHRDEVWMKDLGSGRESQLTHAGVEESSASPSGSLVAFARTQANTPIIEIVETGGGVPARLCEGCSGPGGWSGDGTRLLYARGDPSTLLLHDFRSNTTHAVASHPAWRLERPRLSPDGARVAFHSANAPNVRQVYTVPLGKDGPLSRDKWMPVVTDHGCHPSWSPDGARLYHFSFRDGAFCPWMQRLERRTGAPIGAPQAVQHFHQPRLRAATGAAAFSDVQAGYLYLTLTEATGNIWMLTASER